NRRILRQLFDLERDILACRRTDSINEALRGVSKGPTQIHEPIMGIVDWDRGVDFRERSLLAVPPKQHIDLLIVTRSAVQQDDVLSDRGVFGLDHLDALA